ncbi:uncharacterized protein CTRU02_207208 [Colletotrichum truncatum]|uniref:Uncharacterized protein n=1 Tax=Colletotrichum truncatum TaxID=5467 RepID=A0ACC3Z058_COLTU
MFGFYLTDTPDGIPTCLILSTSGSKDAVKSLCAHHISNSLHPIQDINLPLPDYNTTLDVYHDILLGFRKSKCEELAQTPAVFILIYLNLSLHTFSQNVTALFKVFTRWNIRAPGQIIEDISTLKAASSRALKSAEDFARDNGTADSSETTAVLAELRRLETSINGLSERVVNHTNALAVTASLDESRKAIQMTDSVKLLTQLAFIFIPLTFSASIFGMNFEELGSGTLHITSFVSTAFAITGTTMVAFWVSRALSGKRRALVLFAISFSVYSPRRAFLLMVFLVFGTIDTSWGDLIGFSGADVLLKCINADFDKAENFKVTDITTSLRWQAWLLPFEEFVANPEWKEQYVWQSSHMVPKPSIHKPRGDSINP